MSDNAKLEEILNGYKVGELKELAKVSGVTGYSKLKKAELIETVSKQLLSVDTSALDIPDELLTALTPVADATPKKEVPKQEKKAAGTGRSSTPIIGVAPHIMNVMPKNQTSTAPVVSRPVRGQKIYPNDPCPCGSGKKYKKCCGRR